MEQNALVDPVMRGKIMAMQAQAEALPVEDRVECKLRHFFAPGMYGREITIPAGTLVVGKIHREGHLSTITVGRCLVVTEMGKEELRAPYTFVSLPGVKRAVLTLEDTVWTTYHTNPDNTRDLAELERRIIAGTYEDLGQGVQG